MKSERTKKTRAEIIREKLARASPESRERIKAAVIATLTHHELRTGTDVSALKEAVDEA